MTANSEQSGIANLVQRFWWIAVIVIILLVFLCGMTQAEQILKLFNPPTPTEAVTQPPTDTVTEPPATERSTDEPTDEPTDDPTDEPGGGDGACNAPCSPNASNCLTGLSCVPSTADPSKFICWNADICLDEEATPVVTETEQSGGGECECRGTDLVCPTGTSFNSPQCGGSGMCECREPDKTWACPDGTYAPFNPNCGVGGGPCADAVAGDGVCDMACETYPSEPACG